MPRECSVGESAAVRFVDDVDPTWSANSQPARSESNFHDAARKDARRVAGDVQASPLVHPPSQEIIDRAVKVDALNPTSAPKAVITRR
jgi:hypothetical protein